MKPKSVRGYETPQNWLLAKTFKQIDNSSDKLHKSVGRVSEIVISSCTNIILSRTGFYLEILWKIYLFRQFFFAMLYRHTGGRQA